MNTPKPKTIALSPIKSNLIASIGHDGTTLAVQFKGKDGNPGSVYHYHDVSAEQFNALKKAESIGSHFGKNIRPNFKATKI